MPSKPELREWTVMFYFASDNPLAPGSVANLKAIKNAGYHPEVNVLAQFDPHTVNTPVHIFDVNRIEKLKNPNKANIGFARNEPFVRNLVTDKLWEPALNKRIRKALKGRLDIVWEPPVPTKEMRAEQSPDESLRSFLQFCQKHYPARHYMLFLVGHGMAVGNELFLHDEHVPATRMGNLRPKFLTLIDLAKILDEFNKSLRRPEKGSLELIGFHACSMSSVEVAFQLQGKANYMLASQGTTYNNSWPYRQILIRLFNDLNSGGQFTEESLSANGLIDSLKLKSDPISKYFRTRFNGNGTQELLDEHVVGERPAPKLAQALAHKFNAMLADSKLSEEITHVKLPAATKAQMRNYETNEFDRQHRKRLNWNLLHSAFPPAIAQANQRLNVKRLCSKIFDYCLFNSFDFQLAGYSCDLTLCDLNKVDDLREPISNLVKILKRGLNSGQNSTGDTLIRNLILMAHLDSQSFYQEQYTDLYDFCLRLRAKCEQAKKWVSEANFPLSEQTRTHLRKIDEACREVMTKLKKGEGNDNDGVILRSEFVGPAYQYSHGLSIFFPWSEPVANPMWQRFYKRFAFKETRWHHFLNQYFAETKREPAGDEVNDVEQSTAPKGLDQNLLHLFQGMAMRVLNDGHLGRAGSKDPMGVAGSRDPQGDDCECQSIKNFPSITHSDEVTPSFFDKQVINMFRQFGKEFNP